MADLIYSSGTHTVTSGFDSLYVSGTAIVTLNTGASGSGHAAISDLVTPANTQGAIPAIIQIGGTLIINAGTYSGGAGVLATGDPEGDGPAPAIYSVQGALTIAGGTFTGGTSVDRCGAPAAIIGLPTSLSITGGSFTGGAAAGTYNLDGAPALTIGLDTISASIDSTTTSGGAGVGTGSLGYDCGFSLSSAAHVTIGTSCSITGRIEMNYSTSSYIDVSAFQSVVPARLDGGLESFSSVSGYTRYSL